MVRELLGLALPINGKLSGEMAIYVQIPHLREKKF
jgi:hypothetical protein